MKKADEKPIQAIEKELLNVTEIALVVGVHPNTIREKIKKGLPVQQHGKGSVLKFNKKAVLEWWERYETNSVGSKVVYK